MANLQELIPAFFVGPGGARLTPEQIAARQEVAKSLLAQATDTSPTAGGWASIATKGLMGLSSGLKEGQADRAAAANAESSNANVAAMLASLGGAPAMATSAPSMMDGSSIPSTVDISGSKQEFIDSLLPAAIEESARTGVDPRIIVAQAAQETGWGKSAPGNNYFGIKSHGQAGGNTLATTEYVNGQPQKESGGR